MSVVSPAEDHLRQDDAERGQEIINLARAVGYAIPLSILHYDPAYARFWVAHDIGRHVLQKAGRL